MTSTYYPSYLNDKSFYKKRTGEEIAVTNMPLDEPYKRAQIEAAIKQSTGYASLSFIANKSKVGRDDARSILLRDRRFRKSLIIASIGLTRNDYSACHPLERGDPQVFEKSGFPFARE